MEGSKSMGLARGLTLQVVTIRFIRCAKIWMLILYLSVTTTSPSFSLSCGGIEYSPACELVGMKLLLHTPYV